MKWLLLLFLCVLPASAQSFISGHLYRRNPNSQQQQQYATPAPGIAVTVWSTSSTMGRSNPAYSDATGFWSLYNIPAGTYVLEVWVTPTKPWTFPITVNQPKHYYGIVYVP